MPEVTPSRYLVRAGWNHVPHLSEDVKAELLASIPPYLREARTEGVPSLGAGAIYPVPWGEISVKPFQIPAYWPRAYALDVGWNKTAAVWGARDRETDTVYLYSEYYAGRAEPAIHASAIRARGEWIPGVIDPASGGRLQSDGEQMIALFRGNGLTLTPADNSVEVGLLDVYQRLTTGRLKVFSTLLNWQAEYMEYRRDANGRVVKENDHIMDATRYLVRSGIAVMRVHVPAARGPLVQYSGPADDRAGY